MNMPRIYILSSEVEMVAKALGLSLLNRHVKRGVVVYVLLCLSSSTAAQLKIYSELSTLLVDISVSTSLKGVPIFPKIQRRHLLKDSEHSGEVWRDALPSPYGSILKELQPPTTFPSWAFVSCDEWMNWLNTDLYGIGAKDLSVLTEVRLMELSEGYTSVQAACKLPLIRVDSWRLSPLLAALSLQWHMKNCDKP